MSRSSGRYTRHVLRPGEEVIVVGRFHWLYTVIAVLCLLLLGRFVIGVLILARMMIDKWTREIVITSDRLIYKRGWIEVGLLGTLRRSPFPGLNRLYSIKRLLGRMLGYGRIIAAGTERGIIGMPVLLADPVGFMCGFKEERFGWACKPI